MKFGVKTVKFHYSLEFFFINSKNNNDFIGNTNTGKPVVSMLRIAASQRQISWLSKSVTEELSSELPRTNPASGHGRD